jgi:ankyrin repeat protein
LLARGAAVDAAHLRRGGTAFHGACYHNQPACAEALARAGCDVGFKTTAGPTVRQIAEAMGHAAVLEGLRAVVAEQLGAAQAGTPLPELERNGATPAAGVQGLVDQLFAAVMEGDEAVDGAAVGLGRIIALYHRSSASYQTH